MRVNAWSRPASSRNHPTNTLRKDSRTESEAATASTTSSPDIPASSDMGPALKAESLLTASPPTESRIEPAQPKAVSHDLSVDAKPITAAPVDSRAATSSVEAHGTDSEVSESPSDKSYPSAEVEDLASSVSTDTSKAKAAGSVRPACTDYTNNAHGLNFYAEDFTPPSSPATLESACEMALESPFEPLTPDDMYHIGTSREYYHPPNFLRGYLRIPPEEQMDCPSTSNASWHARVLDGFAVLHCSLITRPGPTDKQEFVSLGLTFENWYGKPWALTWQNPLDPASDLDWVPCDSMVSKAAKYTAKWGPPAGYDGEDIREQCNQRGIDYEFSENKAWLMGWYGDGSVPPQSIEWRAKQFDKEQGYTQIGETHQRFVKLHQYLIDTKPYDRSQMELVSQSRGSSGSATGSVCNRPASI